MFVCLCNYSLFSQFCIVLGPAVTPAVQEDWVVRMAKASLPSGRKLLLSLGGVCPCSRYGRLPRMLGQCPRCEVLPASRRECRRFILIRGLTVLSTRRPRRFRPVCSHLGLLFHRWCFFFFFFFCSPLMSSVAVPVSARAPCPGRGDIAPSVFPVDWLHPSKSQAIC